MRRTLLTTSLITAAGLALTGVSTCGPQGPGRRTFASGSLVIPMDNCYQRREGGAGVAPCNAAADDGVFRAYGLVYFLLKHNVTVYWAINNTKTSSADATNLDVAVAKPASAAAAQKLSWADFTFTDLALGGNGINYIGGPYVIDSTEAPTALALLQNDPDFKRFRDEANAATKANTIEIHRVQNGFEVAQVRPLNGPPPKLGILNINPGGKKTSSNVMYQYAVAAGLSWPCAGTGDCAGGLGNGCSKAAVLAYLASPQGDTAIPQFCNGALCAPNFNQGTGSGQIYDLLCDSDFVPPGAGKTYADTELAKGNYKMLWIPHWDSAGTTPTGSGDPNSVVPLPPVTAGDTLAWQLKSLSSFVNAGNNLFVECMGMQVLEGIVGQDNVNGGTLNTPPLGIPATRFQTGSGILKWNTFGAGTASQILKPAHPNMQIGDFGFVLQSGAIETYYPDSTKAVADAYLPAVERLITQNTTGSPAPIRDASSTIQLSGTDGSVRGTVAYLGGHNYSPNVGNTPGSGGQTAGTRIVLNTLFNLGFGCSTNNEACTTGGLGACSAGVMKCVGGSPQCVQSVPKSATPDCNTPGADANCNGNPDQQEQACQPAACLEGSQRECYDGPASTGLWGPCMDQKLPQPEVCNGLDDACTGGTPDQGKLCADGYSCQTGICLPIACNSESARCPSGFTCDGTQKCVGQPCAGNGGLACGPGQVCQTGACQNPCDKVVCGSGASCSGGQCLAGGCAIDPTKCTASELCVSGTCVADPCANLTPACPEGTFCRVGPEVNGAYVADCVRSCSYVGCPSKQTCGSDGFCQSNCSPACEPEQTCQAGACVADALCAAVQCGVGQGCHAGACSDNACGLMHPCSVGSCVDGQCVGGNITTSQLTPLKALPQSGGGCGTGGGADLATLALGAAALLLRRRRLAPAFLRAAPLGLVALLALGSACGKKGTTPVACTGGQTACGGECAALETSTLHCGECGHGCATGFQCTAGSCAFPTGNPHLVSVEPATVGLGDASPTLKFTFDGLAAQPKTLMVRLSGVVAAQELPLTVDGTGRRHRHGHAHRADQAGR